MHIRTTNTSCFNLHEHLPGLKMRDLHRFYAHRFVELTQDNHVCFQFLAPLAICRLLATSGPDFS